MILNHYWCFRSIFDTSDIGKPHISFQIADEKSIRLQLDLQHDSQILAHEVQDLRFENPRGKGAFLSSIISNSIWQVPTPRCSSLIDIFRSIQNIHIDNTLHRDKIYWRPSPSREFSISFAYNIQIQSSLLPWARSRYLDFYLSLSGLLYNDSQHQTGCEKSGITNDRTCSLCGGQDETIKRLFFECTTITVAWDDVKTICGIPNNATGKMILSLNEHSALYTKKHKGHS